MYWDCQNYSNGRGGCNATHYIRLDFLEQVVMQEINRLTEFASRYEDDFMRAMIGHNVSGKISDERFQRMTKRYEDEQRELLERRKALKDELEKSSSQSMTTDMFIATVRKYTRARKLTPRLLNELVK